jgi:hypothetical protein
VPGLITVATRVARPRTVATANVPARQTHPQVNGPRPLSDAVGAGRFGRRDVADRLDVRTVPMLERALEEHPPDVVAK